MVVRLQQRASLTRSQRQHYGRIHKRTQVVSKQEQIHKLKLEAEVHNSTHTIASSCKGNGILDYPERCLETSTHSHRKYFDWLAHELGLQIQHDWYSVSTNSIIQRGGAPIMQHYNNSVYEAMKRVYKEYEWFLWLFDAPCPRGFWKEPLHQRQYLDWIAQHFGIETQAEWFAVSWTKLPKSSGIKACNGGVGYATEKILASAYPEYIWNELYSDHIREEIETLSNVLHITTQEQWYDLELATIFKVDGGRALLKRHNYSLVSLLAEVYPEYIWHSWRFKHGTLHHWKDPRYQRKYMDWLADELHVKEQAHWYAVTADEFRSRYGAHLLDAIYKGSIFTTLQSVYPEFEWHHWLTAERENTKHWQSIHVQRSYFEWLAEQLGIREYKEWYSVSHGVLTENHGSNLLRLYHGSLPSALQSSYPEYTFNAWQFQYIEYDFWDQQQNVQKFLSWLSEQMNIRSQVEWYRVSVLQIIHYGGGTLLKKYGGIAKLLDAVILLSHPYLIDISDSTIPIYGLNNSNNNKSLSKSKFNCPSF
jgi:hypothetical protein